MYIAFYITTRRERALAKGRFGVTGGLESRHGLHVH